MVHLLSFNELNRIWLNVLVHRSTVVFPHNAVSKVESDDAHSELSDATPLSSIEVLPPKSSSPIQPVEPGRALLGDLEEDDIHPLIADPEAVRLETQLDTWCLDLKRNVLVR